ncbi:MAG TPA: fused MFS/spermidine synthase [Thermodesulfovibrionales bacterium]|nr:fused MFS/spermidine synthase [Thermodesulfovibrionales bacterium]
MSIITAYLITFIASFCILVIEIVAGRILAPFVGVSLYTWTSIIGVVLTGISIGAYLGGKMADRFPERKTLGWLLLLSGITTLCIAPMTNLVAGYHFPTTLMLRILIVTTLTFFIPSCILGMISPVVVKLTLRDMKTAGNVVGRIYAVSTLGSIIGTFAAGFFLISWMGTRHIILLMGLILILTALVWGSLFKSKKTVFGLLIVIPLFLIWGVYGFAFKAPLDAYTNYYKESDYFTLKVKEATASDGKTPLKALVLDNLTHSYVNLKDPLHIEYKYEKIYAEVLKWRFSKDTPFRSLTIGGGGYTLPRYMEVSYPHASIDVVEIDPEITRVVYDYLGLSRNTRIRTFNEDGRWYVMNCKERYDLIFIDAYNDLSIPYHLTTREFAQMLRDILNPEGIILTNIIDNFQRGSFLPSTIRTLREVFGERNVHLISISPHFDKIHSSTFIVLTGKDEVDIRDFESYLKNRHEGKAISAVVPENILNDYLKRTYSVVLRDNYAPVDNLIAPVFEERFGYNRKER